MASKTRRKATKIKLKKLRKMRASLEVRPLIQSSLPRVKLGGLKSANKVLLTISPKVMTTQIWPSDLLSTAKALEADLPKLVSNWTKRLGSSSEWSNSCSTLKRVTQNLTRRRQTDTILPPKKAML